MQVILNIPDEALSAWNALADLENPGVTLTAEQRLAINRREVMDALLTRLKARKMALAQRDAGEMRQRLQESFTLTPAG